jgi:hypothetical protein
MIYTAVVAALSFMAPPTAVPTSRSSAVTMAEPALGRREMLSFAAAAVSMAPLAAVADGASSPAVLERSRAIYGSRIARLADASADAIVDEKNVFTLFETGAYPRTGNAAFKDTQKALKAAGKKAVAAAKAGDKAGANAAVKEFVAIGEIRVLDDIDGAIFNPRQRRNPGAPPTSEIEAQMGTQAYSLYRPLKEDGRLK